MHNELKNQIHFAKEQYNYGHFVIQCLFINRLDQINFKMVSHLLGSQDLDDGTIKEDFLPTLKLLMKYYQSKMLSDASHCQVLQPRLSSATRRISLANIRASRDSTLVDGLFTPSSQPEEVVFDPVKTMDLRNQDTLKIMMENQSIDQKVLN